MNPEEANETLVIETVPAIVDDCADFQCITEENDPLDDPLSTIETPSCSKDNLNQKENPEEDQIIRLINVQELKELKIESKELPTSKTTDTEQPSCSKASEDEYPPPPTTPDFEFEDLEDLIEASKICCTKKTNEEPVASTSKEEENEKWEIFDETSVSSVDDVKNELKDIFLEDFEDQITQNVVNKSVSQVTEIDENSTESENPQETVISDDKDEVEEIEPPKVTEISEEIPNDVKIIEVGDKKEEILVTVQPEIPPVETFEEIPTETAEIVPVVIDTNTTREVEESLAVIVEAVDLIQQQKSESLPSTSKSEPTRDEEDGGLRSDGSDSGLGSEMLEKSLTTTKLPDPPAKGNLKRRSSEQIDACHEKRSKKGIQFEGVTVYSFPRQQGFSCVPSQGGCTLGMANQHCGVKYYTLTEHSAEQRRNHRQQLAELNPRSSSSDDSDSEYEPTDSSSDADSEVYGFLQPVSARQRRALLKSAGVRKIDTTEKDECKMIRTWREVCGCTCRVYCDPDTCACSLSGIKCQVDRPNFPCGCTREGCGNVVGRVEFSPMRVRTHYIHTVMRLQMENKQERLRSSTNAASTASTNSYKAWQQSNVRQVPSSSTVAAVEEQQQPPPQHCDFSLIYDNHSSISAETVSASPAVSAYSYQSDTSYVSNYDQPYTMTTTTPYPEPNSYDPAYMTAYAESQQQQQTYQLHSYDHHSYAMQPPMNYQYPPNASSSSSPATQYIVYSNNGYLQSHIQLCDQPTYSTTSQTNQILAPQMHYVETSPVPQQQNNVPAINKQQPLILENQNNATTTNGGTSENLCEIIKKGIVETVSG